MLQSRSVQHQLCSVHTVHFTYTPIIVTATGNSIKTPVARGPFLFTSRKIIEVASEPIYILLIMIIPVNFKKSVFPFAIIINKITIYI